MTRSPLDYRTPSPPQGERGDDDGGGDSAGGFGFSLGIALRVALFVGVLCIILVLVIPRLENVFKDFGTQLPFATVAVLNLSRWFRSAYLLWPIVLSLPVLAGLFAPRSKSGQRWIRLLMTVCFAGIVLLVALAVLMPMMSLVETISNPKR